MILLTYAQCERHQRVAQAIAECSDHLWVGWDEDGPRLQANHCHNRQCPECQWLRGKHLAHHITCRMSAWSSPKLVTLTLKPHDESLRATIKRLKACFGRLRRRSVWKQLVRGGIYVLEITRPRTRDHWHVHVHMVLDSRYIPQTWLSEEWHKITGDSFIVDVRRADKGAAKYLAKYVSKASEAPIEDFERWPYADELYGMRTVQAFGAEPSINDVTDDVPQVDSRVPLIPLSRIFNWAREGDEVALGVIDQLADRYPWLFSVESAEGP